MPESADREDGRRWLEVIVCRYPNKSPASEAPAYLVQRKRKALVARRNRTWLRQRRNACVNLPLRKELSKQ